MQSLVSYLKLSLKAPIAFDNLYFIVHRNLNNGEETVFNQYVNKDKCIEGCQILNTTVDLNEEEYVPIQLIPIKNYVVTCESKSGKCYLVKYFDNKEKAQEFIKSNKHYIAYMNPKIMEIRKALSLKNIVNVPYQQIGEAY